mmetsp:Transcript_29173/g.92974  ORF Transcript_29173/g.92974 Transcript_29173/m.92974 type:complete len:200 (-) Transcript_29173:633-1232(-)
MPRRAAPCRWLVRWQKRRREACGCSTSVAGIKSPTGRRSRPPCLPLGLQGEPRRKETWAQGTGPCGQGAPRLIQVWTLGARRGGRWLPRLIQCWVEWGARMDFSAPESNGSSPPPSLFTPVPLPPGLMAHLDLGNPTAVEAHRPGCEHPCWLGRYCAFPSSSRPAKAARLTPPTRSCAMGRATSAPGSSNAVPCAPAPA